MTVARIDAISIQFTGSTCRNDNLSAFNKDHAICIPFFIAVQCDGTVYLFGAIYCMLKNTDYATAWKNAHTQSNGLFKQYFDHQF